MVCAMTDTSLLTSMLDGVVELTSLVYIKIPLFFRWVKKVNCLIGEKVQVGGKEVQIVLLEDPAYPLLPRSMKGFSDNAKLSRKVQLHVK